MPEVMLIALAAVAGLILGSFLNVVVHRLPKMMEQQWREQCAELNDETTPPAPAYNLATPASSCPKCGHRIRWFENIPVLSYLIQKGRCSSCKEKISPRYPLVELAAGILAGAAVWKFGATWHAVAVAGFLLTLLVLSAIDIDTYLLPDGLVYPLLWSGLLTSVLQGTVPLEDAVIGAIAGYMSLWLVYWVFKLLTKKEGMGFGDFKLFAAIGAWLGWQALPLVLVLASAAGAIVGITMIVFAERERSKPIPFGPWLAAGGALGILWTTELMHLNVV